MGRRKISFESATIWDGLDGLMAIEVSLCGPGSLLTSTLERTETRCVAPGPGSGLNPGAETVWNLFHQVGWLYAEEPGLAAPAAAGAAPRVSPRTKIEVNAAMARDGRAITPPSADHDFCFDGMRAQAGKPGKSAGRPSGRTGRSHHDPDASAHAP